MGLFHRKSDPYRQPERRRRGGGLTRTLLILLILAVTAAVLLGTGVIRTGITANVTAFGLKDIGELATQAGYFTSVQSIQAAREILGWEVPFSQSNYIFSYDGIIKAGLNFADIEVSVDDTEHVIRIRLPEIRILSVEIDESSFTLYNQSENILTPLRMEDVNAALAKLKATAKDTAAAQGILKNAEENAKVLIRGFLAGCYDLTVYRIVYESD